MDFVKTTQVLLTCKGQPDKRGVRTASIWLNPERITAFQPDENPNRIWAVLNEETKLLIDEPIESLLRRMRMA